MIPNFSPQKETILYNQAVEGVWKVNSLSFLCSEHFELETSRKFGNQGSKVTVPKALKSTVRQLLLPLSYQNEDIFWEVKNNYSHFFWKLKTNFPSKNKENYFMSYISTALREFPRNYSGGGAGPVLSLAFKNRSGYQVWSTSPCLSQCPNLSYSTLRASCLYVSLARKHRENNVCWAGFAQK